MITRDDVRTMFVTLTSMGVLPPEPWRAGSDASRAEAVDGALRCWIDAFSDTDPEDFRRGVRAYIHTSPSTYWPMPANIRALIRETGEARALTADEAVDALLLLARRIGSYRPKPEIEGSEATKRGAEAVIAAVGGWSAFCGSTVDAAFLARCRRVYEAAVAAVDRADTLQRLETAPTPRQIGAGPRRVS
jgi:hypothetical protein